MLRGKSSRRPSRPTPRRSTRWHPRAGQILDGAAAWKTKQRRRSALGELTRPALLHLRLRAIFGTGARADVIAAFLGSDAPDLSVAEVADIGYTKRNIANVLDDLAATGVLRATKVRNQLRYQWARRDAMQALVEPLPREIPNWQPIVELVLYLYWFVAKTEAMPPLVRGVEAVTQLVNIRPTLDALRWSGLRARAVPDPEKEWDTLAQWTIKVVRTLASGSVGAR